MCLRVANSESLTANTNLWICLNVILKELMDSTTRMLEWCYMQTNNCTSQQCNWWAGPLRHYQTSMNKAWHDNRHHHILLFHPNLSAYQFYQLHMLNQKDACHYTQSLPKPELSYGNGQVVQLPSINDHDAIPTLTVRVSETVNQRDKCIWHPQQATS